jgi:hypothetical protein
MAKNPWRDCMGSTVLGGLEPPPPTPPLDLSLFITMEEDEHPETAGEVIFKEDIIF